MQRCGRRPGRHARRFPHLCFTGVVAMLLASVKTALLDVNAEDVMHMRRTADRLFGDAYQWSVLGAGASQMRVAAQSVALGGNMRVGLEDSLWAGPGQMSTSNAQQVEAARVLVESLGAEMATPAEARAMLCLKGPQNVGF